MTGLDRFSSNRAVAISALLLARCAGGARPLHYTHIKSHTGHPWNELADTLAAGAHKDVGRLLAPLPMAGWGAEDFEAMEHYLTL